MTSQMTEGEFEELSDEEVEPERLRTQMAQVKALQSIDQVKDIVKYLMMYSGNPIKVLRALNKLLVRWRLIVEN